MTKDELREVSDETIDMLRTTVSEVDELRADPMLSLAEKSRLIHRRSLLDSEINQQLLVRAHLEAASVIIDFTTDEESSLEELNQKMDKLVLQGLALSAVLGLIPKMIDTAEEIGSITMMHIA